MKSIKKSSFQSHLFLDQKEKPISIIPFVQANFDLSVLKSLEKNNLLKQIVKKKEKKNKEKKSQTYDYQHHFSAKSPIRLNKITHTSQKEIQNLISKKSLTKYTKSQTKYFSSKQRKLNQIDSKFGYYSPIVCSPRLCKNISHKIPFKIKSAKKLMLQKENIKNINFQNKDKKHINNSTKKIMRQRSSQRIQRITKHYR